MTRRAAELASVMPCLLLGGSLVLVCNPTSLVHAASPITPSGLNTQVTLSAMPPAGKIQYDVTGGTRPGGGLNLYHSFGNFNVPTNNISNFLNTGSIDLNGVLLPPNLPTANILGRISGGNPSSIFGMIQTNGPGGFPNANLFLMNANGFLFGPTATINVGGMVSFTTADYMRLTDSTRFNAVAGPADALLTAAPVAAFGFLGNNPAAIAIQGGRLQVAQGQSLSLVGGNQGFIATNPDTGNPIPVPGGMTITGGNLSAPGGQINLASVASPGEVLSSNFQSTATGLGLVNLSQGATLDVSGVTAGSISIRGGQFVMDHASLVANATQTTGGPAGAIAVEGNSVSLTNGATIAASTSGLSPGSAITITARDSVSLAGSSTISTTTTGSAPGSGPGGAVTITAGQSLSLSGNQTGILTTTTQQAPGGNITVQASDVRLTNGAVINADTHGSGRAGNISVRASTVTLDAGSRITSTSEGAGSAGEITVQATDSLTLTGEAAEPVTIGGVTFPHFPSTIAPATFANGPGGRLTVSAPTLTLQKGVIGAQTFFGSGNAGDVVVNAGRVVLTEGALISASTAGSGAGGSVTVRATDSISIDGQRMDQIPSGNTILTNALSGIFTNAYGTGHGGVISVSSPSLTMGAVQGGGGIGANTFGPGNAGSIEVEVGSLTMRNGAQISGTTLGTGQGGTVAVTATDSISISGRLPGLFGIGSLVFKNNQSGIVSLTLGAGKAGRLTVSAADLSLDNEGAISAATGGRGAAGDLVVNTGTLSLTHGGQISSSSGIKIGDTVFVGNGPAGTVSVTSAGVASMSGAGSGLFTSAAGNGSGGNINLVASQVQLMDGASISAKSFGLGNAGNIQITAGTNFSAQNSSVTTQASHASGGNITATAGNLVQLTNSQISASVLDGTGGGGSVTIDPQFVLLENSQILANAVFGPGGNIFITTNLLLPDSTSVISASSQFGQNGTITVQSPIAPASRIIPLSQKPLIATSLLNLHCAKLAQGNFSSFTVAGRDSLPAEPGSWLNSPLASAVAEFGGSTVSEPETHPSLSEPTEETPILSLRRIAPPGFLIQSFAADWSDCTS